MTPWERRQVRVRMAFMFAGGFFLGLALMLWALNHSNRFCPTACVDLGDYTTVPNG